MATAQLYSRNNAGKKVQTAWGEVEFDKDGFGTLPSATDEDMKQLAALDWLATDEKMESLEVEKKSKKALEKAQQEVKLTPDPVKEAHALEEPRYAPIRPSEAEPPAGTPRKYAVENPHIAMIGEKHVYAPEIPSEAEHNIEKKRDTQAKEAAVENAKQEYRDHEAARLFALHGGDPVDKAGELNKAAIKSEKMADKRAELEAQHEDDLHEQAHADEDKKTAAERKDREFMAQQEEMEKSTLVTPPDAPKAESLTKKDDGGPGTKVKSKKG